MQKQPTELLQFSNLNIDTAMNEQLNQLLLNYREGVPVKVERSTVVMLSAAALMVVALSALIVKLVKKI